MGLFDMQIAQDDQPQRAESFAPAVPTTWGEYYSEKLDEMQTNFNPQFILPYKARFNRANEYSKLSGGGGLYGDSLKWAEANNINVPVDDGSGDWFQRPRSERIADLYIEHLRTSQPTKYGTLETNDEIEQAKLEIMDRESKESDEAALGASTFAQYTVPLAAGFRSGLQDPINLITMPIGAASGASLLKIALVEGAVNAGVELLEAPMIAPWQRELGRDYGFKEIALQAGTAAVAGGLFSAGIAKGGRAIGRAWGKAFPTPDPINPKVDAMPSPSQILKSEGLERLSSRLHELGYQDGADGAKYLARDAHLSENNLARASREAIPLESHERALLEINDAYHGARQIDHNNIKISDRDILMIDPDQIQDPGLRGNIERMQDYAAEPIAQKLAQEQQTLTHKVLSDPADPDLYPQVKSAEDIADDYVNPDFIQREIDEFNKLPDDELLDIEGADEPIRVGDLKKAFDNDEALARAITECGI